MDHYSFKYSRPIPRSVLDQFVWRMDWNHVNVFPVQMIKKLNHVNCAARFLAKIIPVRVHLNGIKRHTMCPTCSLNLERHAMITMAIVMFSKNVGKLIRRGHWQH